MADAATAMGRAAAAGAAAPELDELMLAMDVVDTLRHQEGLVEKELGQEERDETLKARLRRLYEGQGLQVSDRILEEGIQALKESRYAYAPPPAGFARTMATLWVRRGTVAKAAAAVVVLAALGVGWQVWTVRSESREREQARIELAVTLPRDLSAAVAAARGEANVATARETINRLAADGEAALAAGDAPAARAAIAKLADLRAELVRQYDLRIVSRPGEETGVFRIPDINREGRNYYLIVEAVTPEGAVLEMPVRNEENGRTETVTKWGIRVPQSTFDAVRRDKEDDGIVQNNRLGEKKRGALDPEFLMPVRDGAITGW